MESKLRTGVTMKTVPLRYLVLAHVFGLVACAPRIHSDPEGGIVDVQINYNKIPLCFILNKKDSSVFGFGADCNTVDTLLVYHFQNGQWYGKSMARQEMEIGQFKSVRTRYKKYLRCDSCIVLSKAGMWKYVKGADTVLIFF